MYVPNKASYTEPPKSATTARRALKQQPTPAGGNHCGLGKGYPNAGEGVGWWKPDKHISVPQLEDEQQSIISFESHPQSTPNFTIGNSQRTYHSVYISWILDGFLVSLGGEEGGVVCVYGTLYLIYITS